MIKQNHRGLLFELLQENNLSFPNELTLVIMESTQTSALGRLMFPVDKILMYHVNGPRVSSKSHPINTLNQTFLSDYLDLREAELISSDQIFETKVDPFYLKKMDKMGYPFIYLFPIIDNEIKDETLQGFLILYYTLPPKDFVLKNARLVKLVKAICQSELGLFIEERCEEVINGVSDKVEIYFLLSGDKDYYFDKSGSLITLNPVNYKVVMEKRIILSDEVYMLKTLTRLNDGDKMALGRMSLKSRQIFSKYHLIYCRHLDHKEVDLAIELKELLDERNYLVFQVSHDSILVYIEGEVPLRLVKNLMKQKRDYHFVLIKSGIDIPVKADFEILVEFLEISDETFSKDLFQQYCQLKGQYQLKIDQVRYGTDFHEVKIFNSKSKEDFGILVSSSSYTHGLTNLSNVNKAVFEKAFDYLMKNEVASSFVFLDMTTLGRRSVWEMLKKLVKKDTVLILTNLTNDLVTLMKHQTRLIELGFKLYHSCEIFQNAQLVSLIKPSEGLFFSKIVMKQMMLDPEYVTLILNFYSNRGKKIITEIDQKTFNYFEHSQIYLMVV